MDKKLFQNLLKFYGLEEKFFQLNAIRADYVQIKDIRTDRIHCLRF